MESISMTHTQGFAIGMTWYTLGACKRQLDFPSWSWAGWGGEFAADFLVNHYVPSPESYKFTILVELKKGHTVGFPSANALPAFSSQYGATIRFIIVSSATFSCSIVFFPPPNKDSWAPDADGGYFVETRSQSYNRFLYSKLYLTDMEYSLSIGNDEGLLGIVIGSTTGPDYNSSVALLVKKKGSYAERLGIFILSPTWWCPGHGGQFLRCGGSAGYFLMNDIGGQEQTTRLG
jgi:hypothetical protein